jgi:hypothetical protein
MITIELGKIYCDKKLENYFFYHFEMEGVVIGLCTTPCRLCIILGIIDKYMSRIF